MSHEIPQRETTSSNSSITTPRDVIIFTRNITRRPILWDPMRQRPTQELVHSVHAALHFALDPCVNHPDEAPSFCVLPHGSENESRLFIPCLNDLVVKPEEVTRNAKGEMTAKFFAGFDGSLVTVNDVGDALEALNRSTGACSVDKFVVSLDNVQWNGEEEVEGDQNEARSTEKVDQIEALAKVWPQISSLPSIKRFGVSDFSPDHLARFFDLLRTNACYSRITSGNEENVPARDAKPRSKLPTINQLSFESDVPSTLTEFAQREGIELVSHSDNLGTKKQFVNLLQEFKNVLPLPTRLANSELDEAAKAFRLKWVLKYTVFLPDRGLVSDKGYILAGSFTE